VCRDTLYDWSRQDEKSEFSYMLKQLISDYALWTGDVIFSK